MKRFYLIIFILLSYHVSVIGQIQNLRSHTQMTLDCKKCHICDTPTKANPCLVQCPRNKIEIIRHLPDEGPDDIIIDKTKSEKDLYRPVKFTHRLHSEMSLMAGGCSICHHFNPPGNIVSCNHCHENKRERTDLSKPDLKAAFHRQCMGCHKQWEQNTECKSCHILNTETIEETSVVKKTKSHPEISIPKRIIYETESDEGNIVTFFHNDHSSLFEIECNNCHDSESCVNCHSEFRLGTLEIDLHDKCSSCHEVESKCKSCHSNSIKAPFSHYKKTGFDLAIYHNGIGCSKCHQVKNKYSGLNKDCMSCHLTSDGYFNHRITGLQLDETHIEFYCENCHLTVDYSQKPDCSECHDDDIKFPQNIPGNRVK